MRFLFAFLASVIVASATGQVRFGQSGETVTTITGTSTLHDWSMTSKRATYHAVLDLSEAGVPVGIKSLSYSVECESLKSGHAALDRNAYSTLDTDAFKRITFTLTEGRIAGQQIHCTGDLTIAGTTKPVNVVAQFKRLAGGALLCIASQSLKMSDFGIDPPVFMFGTIRTDDEITIRLQVTLSARE